jgi:hypothetical protein
MGKSWEDVDSDGVGHRTYIKQELDIFCRLLYLGVVTADDRWVAARSCNHWGLKSYVNQGTFQDMVAKMF